MMEGKGRQRNRINGSSRRLALTLCRGIADVPLESSRYGFGFRFDSDAAAGWFALVSFESKYRF